MLVPCIECGAAMADDADRCGSCRHAPDTDLVTHDGPMVSVTHPLRPPMAGRLRGNAQQLWLDGSPPARLFKNPLAVCAKLETPPNTRVHIASPSRLFTRQVGIYELRGDARQLGDFFRAIGVHTEVSRPWRMKARDRLKKGGWLPTITLLVKELSPSLAYAVLSLCLLSAALVAAGHGPALVRQHKGWSASVLVSALVGVVLCLAPMLALLIPVSAHPSRTLS